MPGEDCIGKPPEGVTAPVEKGFLRRFAQVNGETNPIYFDEQAAKPAGRRSLPVPSTYLFCVEMHGQSDPMAWLKDIGVDLLRILHGEQRFEYKETVHAGGRPDARRRNHRYVISAFRCTWRALLSAWIRKFRHASLSGPPQTFPTWIQLFSFPDEPEGEVPDSRFIILQG